MTYGDQDIMPQKIDEISETLGEIKSDVSHVRSAVDAMDNKVDIMNKNLIIAEQAVKSAHRRLDDLEHKVGKHETLRNKWAGWMTAMVTIMSFIGATIGMFANQLWNLIFQ